jgi:chromosome segregation ATPase
MENGKETIKSLEAKIKPFAEEIKSLQERNKEVQKRLDSDVIVDMRWLREIADDKNEIIDNNNKIQELEKEVRRWKRSIAILESNKY